MSLLLAYLINGQPCGVVVKSWSESDLNGNPAFAFADSVTAGYQDISSMENWDEFGDNTGADFNYIRNILAVYVSTITGGNWANWDNLTTSQKQLACKYVVAPYALRVPGVVDDATDKENWYNVVIQTNGVPLTNLEGRALIFQKMRIAIAEMTRTNIITLTDSQSLFKDTFILVQWYINSNCPDFKYWFNNTVGTPYENAGFAEVTYFTAPIKAEILTIVNNIYNGVVF
jgi:hypothetical protein